MRLGVSETPKFAEAKEQRQIMSSPVKEAFKTSWKAMLIMGGLSLFVNVGYLAIQVFNVNYVVTATDLSLQRGLIANAIGLVVMMICLPLWGALSDRLGRKPMLLGSIVAFTAVSYPAYALMAQGTFISYLAGQIILGITITAFSGTFISTVVELFPLTVRASGLAFAYNISGVVAIGFTPAIMAYLSNEFDYAPVGPFLWIIAGALFGLAGVLPMRETAHEPLRTD
jgi:MHS family proline/betaine transporter-like MFS transporter